MSGAVSGRSQVPKPCKTRQRAGSQSRLLTYLRDRQASCVSPGGRRLSLALQGGGPLAAFAWGVLDRLLEAEALTFDALSGASAGAVNAVIVAAGLLAGGKAEARRRPDHFWERSSQALVQPRPFASIWPRA